MKVNVKLNFEITKSYLLIICGIIILSAGAIVYATNSGNPALMGHTGDEIVSLSASKLTPGVFDLQSGEFRIEGDGSRVLSLRHPGGTNALFVEGSAEITNDLEIVGALNFRDNAEGIRFSDPDSRTDVYLNEAGLKIIADPGNYVEIGPGWIEFDGEFSHSCTNSPCNLCMISVDGTVEGPMRLGIC